MKSKKFKEKKSKVEYPMFSYEIEIIITNDIPRSYYNRFKVVYEAPIKGGRPAGMCPSLEESRKSVLMVDIDTIRDINDVIAHESYHAIKQLERAICNYDGGEEWFAYQIGYIVGKVHKVVDSFH